jgi:hypothetical protein
VGPHAKWGSSASPLTRAVGSAAGNDSFAMTAFNVNYTDSGLFGFVASSPASIAGKVRYTVFFCNFVLRIVLDHICSFVACICFELFLCMLLGAVRC